MSQLSKILGRYAPGHKISHNDKDYTFNVIARAQRVAIQKAWYRHKREFLKECYDNGEYDGMRLQQLYDELRELYMAGGFDLAGKGGEQMVGSEDGRLILLQNLLDIDEAEAESLLEAHLVEITELVQVIFLESFPDAKARAIEEDAKANGQADPNAPAPLQT